MPWAFLSLNSDPFNSSFGMVDMSGEMWYTNGTKYDADNRVTEVKYDDSDTHKVNLTYDLLNRITNKTVTNGVPYSTNYTYVAGNTAGYGANATTPLISTIEQGSGANAMNFAYTYDSRGNITSEAKTISEADAVTVSYEYDELGQLTRVNDPNDKTASASGTTWVYTYDRGGNILNKSAYGYTTFAVSSPVNQWSYAYEDANWKDKLTKFNGVAITYDAIGNPLSDGTWTYTWEKGHQLKSMHNANTGVTMEFKYNAEGIRTQKVKKVNGAVIETTDHILKGKLIAAMKKNTDTYYFTYNIFGKPVTVNFNGAEYTYVKNFQGDIVGILDASGNKVVEYKYDAWGDAVSIYSASTTVDPLAFDNPFRYRGYIWDEETHLYYLRSRYYNPELSRFLNADCYVSTSQEILSNNMFIYCSNKPILYFDPDGKIILHAYVQLAMDDLGKDIFQHWLYGGGDKLVIHADENLNNYFINNKYFCDKVISMTEEAIVYRRADDGTFSETDHLDLTGGNGGGYRTGYELINGTNATVGDFSLQGNLYITDDPDTIHVVATYTIHDKVDPNFSYGLSEFAAWAFCKLARGFWCGKTYELEITGMIEYDVSWGKLKDGNR